MNLRASQYPADIRNAMRLPPVSDGQRIGLFGGSFNPPHEGHVLVSEMALQRAGLDQVWWMVTPGNPLKDVSGLAPLAERVAACRLIARHPKIRITAFEAGLNTSYSAETLAIVLKKRPRAKFVWVMGADNLAGFHHWSNWRKIAAMMPIIVVDRPGSTLASHSAPAALALSDYRIDESDACLLAMMKPPAWTFIHGPRSSLSSSRIRSRK